MDRLRRISYTFSIQKIAISSHHALYIVLQTFSFLLHTLKSIPLWQNNNTTNESYYKWGGKSYLFKVDFQTISAVAFDIENYYANIDLKRIETKFDKWKQIMSKTRNTFQAIVIEEQNHEEEKKNQTNKK